MKKQTLKKIIVSLGVVGSVSIANGQWAVSNVNDAVYFGTTGLFTQAMGQMNSSVTNSVDAVRQAQGIQIQQNENNQQDSDQRNRAAIVSADIVKRNFDQLPTIQQCVDLTRASIATGGTAASVSSRAGGPNSPTNSPYDPDVAPTLLTRASNVQAQVIVGKSSLDTCDPNYDNGVGSCGSATGAFAGADIRPIGIKANVKGHVTNMDYSNWTLDAAGYQVALKNIDNTTLAYAPKYLNPKTYNNPVYQSAYQAVMQHLFAAQDALASIATLRKTPLGTLGQGQSTIWSTAVTDYSAIFGSGVQAPSTPSSFELMNYEVFSDYEGIRSDDNKVTDELGAVKQMSQRLALSNLIAWQQYQQTENTNILLAHLLVLQTAPYAKALDSAQNDAVTTKK